jgi:hypothetical protein
MNIRSVTTQAVPQPPQTNTPNSPNTPSTVGTDATADSYKPAQNESLVNMLQEQPDVRPEAVERAKNLADDPNYPGTGTIESLAKMFIANTGEE